MKYIKLFEDFSDEKYLSVIQFNDLPEFIIWVDNSDKLQTVLEYAKENNISGKIRPGALENINSNPLGFYVYTNYQKNKNFTLEDHFKTESAIIHYYLSARSSLTGKIIPVLKFEDCFTENPKYHGYHAGKRYGI